MNLVNKVNEISSIDDKLEFIKNSITDENVNEASFIIKTPLVHQLILTIISKHKKGKELKEEEYHTLFNLIHILQTIYNYSGEDTGVSDETYDILYEILEGNNMEIITTPILKKDVVHHKYKKLRGTLEKIYALDDEEELSNQSRKRLSDWVKRSELSYYNTTGNKINLWNEEIYLFPKWDGVSIIFEINEKNEIERALTRGNTELNEAEDKTFIFKAIESRVVIPEMKGRAYGLKTEVMMNEEDLKEYNDECNTEYKSTRSIVSSIINTDHLDGREQFLEIVKLRVTEIINGEEQIETLAPEVFERPFIRCSLKDVNAIRKFSNDHKYVEGLRCDGSVIHIINPDIQKILGREKNKNKFEVAYKFNEEIAYTKLKDIIFQMGTFGSINPVAVVEPVVMKGNEIQKISLGSMIRFNELALSKGDKVQIRYEIIPYLNFDLNDPKCKKSKNPPIQAPEFCPECGDKLFYDENGLGKCVNPDCDFLKKKQIVNYLSKMNIQGISFETISDLYDNKIVKTIKDLYRLKKKRKEIINLRGFGEKKYSLMISEIDSHRDVLDSVFLGSIGIPHCSKEVFKKILNYFSLDDLLDFADAGRYEPLTDANGIGNKKAKMVTDGIRKYRSLILFLKDELNIISGRDSRAYQVRFKACFTMIRSDEITKLIESKGGEVTNSVTKETDFLIAPSATSSSGSCEKARKYNIPIIPINDVEDYIKKNYR